MHEASISSRGRGYTWNVFVTKLAGTTGKDRGCCCCCRCCSGCCDTTTGIGGPLLLAGAADGGGSAGKSSLSITACICTTPLLCPATTDDGGVILTPPLPPPPCRCCCGMICALMTALSVAVPAWHRQGSVCFKEGHGMRSDDYAKCSSACTMESERQQRMVQCGICTSHYQKVQRGI